ncbi:LysR family transcriptional regulator [Billgrantia desiderata]|uniref:LysR family transcriptional regulator n=1 Tax=Billgrantia desiderata TaxID=52021 RepID=UPI00089E815F|nr:LysR family transcriptional regulator [Halomonas desiderata]MCE8011858.1 LysR family transcriptional regulator [Halomonas desiderata]NIC36510.1 LysR family transcriptional regulator [Halomonas desiderata]OUE39661.1 LysR family transcriptional regulator [Halomonas desiderata SP1]SEF89943.1 LysR family transcriptional regulator, carnitine catabolism transcriptional activator [Halomonas desiderata]
MKPSIKQLRAFVAVAQSSSLAEASERIHLSQPAISIALRKLEEAVGGALFSRTTRQLTLTPEGEAFLPVAVRLLNDWSEAFEDLEERFSKQRGKVTVAALPTLAAGLLPGIIAAFHARYPRINLSLHDVLAEQVSQMVREGRADLGLSVAPHDTEELAFEPVLMDRYVAVCPSGHPLLEQESVAWRQLAGHPFIGINRLSSSRQEIDRIMAEVGAPLEILCDASQIATVGRMVAAELGISVLPELSFKQIATDGIDYRPLTTPEVERPLGIVMRHRHPLSAAAAALRALIQEQARDSRG